MTDALRTLARQYASALRRYVVEGNESALREGYELGRRALGQGLGLLEMAAIHFEAVAEACAHAARGPDVVEDEVSRARSAAQEFLLECLSPFEMTHRGFREANAALMRINEALEQEARRIAQALHDETGPLLVSANLALENLARDVGPDARRSVGTIRERLDQIEESLRFLCRELRPPALDELGLVLALEFLSAGLSVRGGVMISVQNGLEVRLPPAVEMALYRIVQEALTNICRHSGAVKADVGLAKDGRNVRCSVRDDGRGFDVNAVLTAGAGGLGLRGIRERLEPLRGTLRIDSAPGRGTDLQIVIPLEEGAP